MILLSLSFAGREQIGDSPTGAIFGGLVLLSVILIYTARRRGRGLAASCLISAAALTLCYLTSSYASDATRGYLSGAILLLGLIPLWLCRHRIWKPLLIATGLLFFLVVVFLSSSSVNFLFFEKFLPKGALYYFLSCLTWLIIQVVIPRTRGKPQAIQAAGLTVVISFVLFAVAAASWLDAIDGKTLPDSPVATTGTELETLFSQPWATRRLGIFVVGVIRDSALRSEVRRENPDFLAYFAGRASRFGFTFSADAFLPPQYDLQMADGAIVGVSGITSVRQAFGWPEAGKNPRRVALRNGDPVVIWTDPGEFISTADGKRTPALSKTRVIAYGSFETFRAEFLKSLVTTSRVFGWIFFICMLISTIPLGFGIRHLLQSRNAQPSI